ncbi:MAG: magnesium/cobalt transporter CorA [Balneolaceae bacterium]
MKRQVRTVSSKLKSLILPEVKRVRKAPGEKPGTVVHTGERRMETMRMTVHDFDAEHYDVIPIKRIERSKAYLTDPSKTWIEVRGLHDIETLKTVWDYFELHPLIQEDIVSTSQRPKVEHYPNAIFVVMRLLIPQTNEMGERVLHSEQISLVLGKNYVLSFQESDIDIFEPIYRRLQQETTRLRRFGPDYLLYALMDTVVDYYFQVLDLIGEEVEAVEESLLEDPENEDLARIHTLRRDVIYLRKSVWSLRDGINTLIRDDSPLIVDEVKVFMRDVYDHLVQVIDSIETSREMVMGMFDMYMSFVSNKMNEVMKVLTIIATIFIPLTFIAGIYGMNFDPDVSPWNMPELGWAYGYPFSLMLMGLLTIGMLIYFRRKKWF